MGLDKKTNIEISIAFNRQPRVAYLSKQNNMPWNIIFNFQLHAKDTPFKSDKFPLKIAVPS